MGLDLLVDSLTDLILEMRCYSTWVSRREAIPCLIRAGKHGVKRPSR